VELEEIPVLPVGRRANPVSAERFWAECLAGSFEESRAYRGPQDQPVELEEIPVLPVDRRADPVLAEAPVALLEEQVALVVPQPVPV
jgi:hypothetical protein